MGAPGPGTLPPVSCFSGIATPCQGLCPSGMGLLGWVAMVPSSGHGLLLGGDLVRPHCCMLRVLLSSLPIRKPPTDMAC